MASVCEEGCDSFSAVVCAKATKGSAAVVYLQQSVSIFSVSDAQVICYYQTWVASRLRHLMALFHCMVRFGTVHFWGVFHWVLYLVPDTFLVPLRSRFQASRTVTKTWRVNSADHWLAGENRHYCVTELATRDPPLQPDPLDLNQHSQRRIGCNFCLNKRTFLHQPQNSSVVVCWGSSDVPLVDSRGKDPARAWWRDAEGKSLMYNVTFELAIFSEYVFCLYFYLCICVLLQLKTIWSKKCTSRLY